MPPVATTTIAPPLPLRSSLLSLQVLRP